MTTLFGIALALGLGVQIGGNSSGVSTGVAFGAGVLSRRRGLALAALFILVGALTLGRGVTETIGRGLLDGAELHFLLTIPIVATLLIGGANLLRAPTSTTQAVVAAIFGVGLALGILDTAAAGTILVWWAAAPLAAIALSFALWFPVARYVAATRYRPGPRLRPALGALVLVSAAYVAFSVGANNAGNTAGPLVGGLGLDPLSAVAVAGLAMVVGTLWLGHRVMETLGEGVTNLCEVRGAVVALTAGTILIVASVAGIPVSLAQTITGGILGVALASHSAGRTLRNPHVRRIALLWTASPLAAAGLAFLVAC